MALFKCPGCGRNTKHYARGLCRSCWCKVRKEEKRLEAEEERESQVKPDHTPSEEESGQSKHISLHCDPQQELCPPVITIDLSKYPDLAQMLVEAAHVEFRTPEQQAAKIIFEYCNELLKCGWNIPK